MAKKTENVSKEKFFASLADTMCGGDVLKVHDNDDGSLTYELYGYGDNLLGRWNDTDEVYEAF